MNQRWKRRRGGAKPALKDPQGILNQEYSGFLLNQGTVDKVISNMRESETMSPFKANTVIDLLKRKGKEHRC